MPESYKAARATKSIVPFSLTQYFANTSKLGFIIYAVLALLIVLVVFLVRKIKNRRKAKAARKAAQTAAPETPRETVAAQTEDDEK